MTTPASGPTGSWTVFRHRGEILRAVADEADLHRDGALPLHLPGVAESFRDDLDLVGALQLRWHTRLSTAIERHLAHQPMDLPAAVRAAWVATALELPGIRAIIDRHLSEPSTPQMARALSRAQAKERVLLATMAGRASQADPRAQEAGARIEDAARATYLIAGSPSAPRAAVATAPGQDDEQRQPTTGSASFVERIKAVLAA